MTGKSLEERFWSHVWRCTHRLPCKRCCWPWTYGLKLDVPFPRYGRFEDVRLPKGSIPAHRFAYILGHGAWLLPFPRALPIRHSCAFRPCCNDMHLSIGTQADNMRDNRGFGWYGARRPSILLPNGETRSLFHPPYWYK